MKKILSIIFLYSFIFASSLNCKRDELYIVGLNKKKDIIECLKSGYEFSDKSIETLLSDGDKDILRYLVKYKNRKLQNKFFPIYFINKGKFFDEFKTNTLQDNVAKCRITKEKDVCKKAVNVAIQLEDYDTALVLAYKSNQVYLLKNYIENLKKEYLICYYLKTYPPTAYKLSKNLQVYCPFKIPNKLIYEKYLNNSLTEAAENNETIKAIRFLKQGADPNTKGRPVYIAVAKDNYPLTKALLDYGAFTHYINPYFGFNIVFSASADSPELLKLILKVAPESYVNQVVKIGYETDYPLHYAFKNHRYENMKILFEHGAKIRDDGFIYYCAFKDNKKMLDLFKKYGYDLNKKYEKYKNLCQ
ncbi:hypothetical protein [Caminibacter pacificus]